MILKPKDFLDPRFEFTKDYPNSPFNVGDILGSYEHDGILYLNTGDGVLQPRLFKDNFRELKWHEHRTIEQLKSIAYARVVSSGQYYIHGDIVPVVDVFYNRTELTGGSGNIIFNLSGHYFIASQINPATKEEYEKSNGK